MKLVADLEIAKALSRKSLTDFKRTERVPWLLEFARLSLGCIVECPRCSEIQPRKSPVRAQIPEYDCSDCGLHFQSGGLFSNCPDRESLLDQYRSVLCFACLHAERFVKKQSEGRRTGFYVLKSEILEIVRAKYAELKGGDVHPGMDFLHHTQQTSDILADCARVLKTTPAMVPAKVRSMIEERDRLMKELDQ